MTRKAVPDVLAQLMGEVEKPESNKAVEQEPQQKIKLGSSKAIKPESNNAVKQAFKIPDVQKEKATFNLSKSVLNDLEDVWMEIRKLRRDKKISKTDIVELSLEESLKDFLSKKDLSKFYSKLASNKAINKVS